MLEFGEIDPYEVLEVKSDASPIEIKKAYKKLSLQHHPDKQQQQKGFVGEQTFPKIQYAYALLSDPIRRQRYDNTGSLHEVEDDFDWKEYFAATTTKISLEMIEEDRIKYQGSEEERLDIVSNFVYYEGDFLKLFELIPHLEFTEDEEARVYNIIDEAIGTLALEKNSVKTWEKYKKSRKTKVKQMLKKLAKEAKEAEALEKQIKDKGKRKLGNHADLAALIKSRQSSRLDTLISGLEQKYGKKRGNDISDDEFDRIQKKMRAGSKK